MLSKKIVGVATSALLLTACSTVNGENGNLAVLSDNAQQSVTMEEAKQIAFNHAGVDGEKATFDDEEYDSDDNQYELEFKVDDTEYEYDIDAESGKILKAEKDVQDDDRISNAAGGEFITLDEAKQIAFDHAGIDGSGAVFDEEELDESDKLYELEFTLDGVEFEFDIDAISGRVLEYERDDDDDDDRASQPAQSSDEQAANNQKQDQQKESQKVEQKRAKKQEAQAQQKQAPAKQAQPKAQQKQAKSSQSQPKQSAAISQGRALEIALSHAGVSRNQISDLEIELDSDDGVRTYEVEFEVGDVEYEYDIRESDGSILDVEIDR